MKLVVLDGYTENPGDLSWAELAALGELTVYDRTSYTESPLIAERIGDADVIVINKTPISKETMDKCPNLKAIAVLATGYNVVDYEYAKAKGIPVMNVPVYGTDNVSQFAVSLLLEVCSHIGHHSDSVYAGEWAENADWCYWHYPMIEVSGKTAGIIGLGRIGVNTAKILKAMNVNVIAYDAFQSEAGKAVADYVELDELLAKSDFIFLHCPLFPSTQGIIGKENIAKMKDGVILVNTSRGGLIKTEDLISGIRDHKFFAVGLDVYEEESDYVFEDLSESIMQTSLIQRLLSFPNVTMTSHQGFFTEEALTNIAETTMENAQAYINGDELKNEVLS
mgnify:CR=1 FL=1